MEKSNDPILYRGMTANQIAEGCDDERTLPNFMSLLQGNREHAKLVKDRLNPVQDVAYGNAPIQKLDIYAPANAKNLPVLIDIHGGGWTAGSKNPRSIPAEAVMSQGVIWVPIDYGLAPEYTMVEIISHVRSAVAWIYHNITHYGGDPHRLYISGQSAGAHLAATTLMPDWHQDFGLPEESIKGLIALSGAYDLEVLIHFNAVDAQATLQLTLETSRNVSPIYHIQKRSIPAIIAYGGREPLLYSREAQDYTGALQNAGHAVSLIVVPGANHFDMINALQHRDGALFEAVMAMILA